MKGILKSFSYAFFSNIISFGVSGLITLIVPKFITIESYGYFQVYIFYLTYIGIMSLGWIDGIVLRYGGAYYEDLNKGLFNGQFRLFSGMEFLIGLIMIAVSLYVFGMSNDGYIYIFLGLTVVLSLPCSFFRYLLQAVNKIEQFSRNMVLDRGLYFCFTIMALVINNKSLVLLLVADVLARMIALVHMLWICRDIVKTKVVISRQTLNEGRENISVGCKLLLANNVGFLIVGVIRYAIKEAWGIETFAKISLAFSVSNLFMIFIRAMSIVVYPLLRRVDENKMKELYTLIRTIMMLILFGIMILYYPLKVILCAWLPGYKDGIEYMALLFPMCIFESKTSMLIETYLKALRKENYLLKINCYTVLISIMLAVFTSVILKNLTLSILAILVVLAFRNIMAEYIVGSYLRIELFKSIFLESIMIIMFVLSSWYIGGVSGLILYILIYIAYIFFEQKELRRAIKCICEMGVN